MFVRGLVYIEEMELELYLIMEYIYQKLLIENFPTKLYIAEDKSKHWVL